MHATKEIKVSFKVKERKTNKGTRCRQQEMKAKSNRTQTGHLLGFSTVERLPKSVNGVQQVDVDTSYGPDKHRPPSPAERLRFAAAIHTRRRRG